VRRTSEGQTSEGRSSAGANLTGAKLRGAKLRGANLRGAKLRGVDLRGADLSGANLITAKLVKVLVPWADLGGALGYFSSEEEPGRRPAAKDEARQLVSSLKLVNPDLSGANLGNAKLVNANLSGANLSGANLHEANLHEADLTGANLHEADLTGANLFKADLRGANLRGANLTKAYLPGANLRGANLRGAKLIWAVLAEANLHEADLTGADLSGAWLVEAYLLANLRKAKLIEAMLLSADLSGANLRGANLRGSYLMSAHLVGTDLTGADLTGCYIHGISAWNLKLERAKQQNLVVTSYDEPEITVDNIEVAQFVYLLLHNEKIRDVIDTIGKKGVLLLGRFTEGRIAILERLREELRKRDFLPIVFNFDKPDTKTFTQTVRLLAGMSRFVIADVTNPRSAPLELQATVPELMVPFRPIIEEGEKPFAMLEDLWIQYRDWVFEPLYYSSLEALVAALDEKIIKPAEIRFAELLGRKAERMKGEHV
jgi:uncharacterized protein YjbI with pentapeptide repeats